MFKGATCRAAAIVGTAVFRIVVSSDSMKKATAINQGNNRLLVSARRDSGEDGGRLVIPPPDDGFCELRLSEAVGVFLPKSVHRHTNCLMFLQNDQFHGRRLQRVR